MLRINPKSQKGQTLIETIVGIFLLATALSAAVGVSIYALSTSANNFNEIIGTNLAREGLEVVRMMRDSNWLASDVKGGVWDLNPCSDIGNRLCYPRAYEDVPPYNSYDLSAGNNRLNFDPSGPAWSLGSGNYHLYLQPDGSYTHTVNGTPVFARKIRLQFNTSSPYTNQNSNSELIVTSTVVWHGKNCAAFTGDEDIEAINTSCKVTLQERLTNWKDYK